MKNLRDQKSANNLNKTILANDSEPEFHIEDLIPIDESTTIDLIIPKTQPGCAFQTGAKAKEDRYC
jgi:hypothetical protein